MAMSINVDLSGLNNFGSRLEAGQREVARHALAEMDEFVPRDKGHLRDSGIIVNRGKTIRYKMPYAAPQFYGLINGYRIHHYTLLGTGRRWDLRLKGNSAKMADLRHSFVKGAELYGSNR
ncbi:minor capsid protein [Companilactobacillus mishanensis]|uniref:Capsid protein n=1 Tax=Companilactobacillus mishanensis TaxID=2486008 RepID=A0A5P0ZF15_9LACO|nr:minor capsid protein [Companilactobacillus mishanensis]MQS44245.1 capsid protein [Companilactobacillus mishanensis]MQS51651.1 capsid protein [Companilactobacillus mishanensis]